MAGVSPLTWSWGHSLGSEMTTMDIVVLICWKDVLLIKHPKVGVLQASLETRQGGTLGEKGTLTMCCLILAPECFQRSA